MNRGQVLSVFQEKTDVEEKMAESKYGQLPKVDLEHWPQYTKMENNYSFWEWDFKRFFWGNNSNLESLNDEGKSKA